MQFESLKRHRMRNWFQDGEATLETSADGAAFIDRVKLATLYAPSSEFPSLLLGHVGQQSYVAEATWDSPAGFVYGWRWEIGKPGLAFYSTIVAKKPTWVSWPLLPVVLAALMERRDPEEVYRAGDMSRDAYRVFEALRASDRPLVTGDLRARAGFPTGKENRAAYLKAVEELESRLLLAKVFEADSEGDEMGHAAVSQQYPDAWRAALTMPQDDAVVLLVREYLESAVYIEPSTFSRHLRLPQALVSAAIERLRCVPVTGAPKPAFTLPGEQP